MLVEFNCLSCNHRWRWEGAYEKYLNKCTDFKCSKCSSHCIAATDMSMIQPKEEECCGYVDHGPECKFGKVDREKRTLAALENIAENLQSIVKLLRERGSR
jgi:hypothetical protein